MGERKKEHGVDSKKVEYKCVSVKWAESTDPKVVELFKRLVIDEMIRRMKSEGLL